ncbi:hypothetical protein H4687_008973 [Streptomyces stelliscabiei]|uniref:Uncharacterized protein n=1 Tax=Streptomyces stelliscabiei TaxID=146820 RepID=A0A8I0PG04_9ACTN|nr:hypothetical protein [Streptomyces stelliscabiei]
MNPRPPWPVACGWIAPRTVCRCRFANPDCGPHGWLNPDPPLCSWDRVAPGPTSTSRTRITRSHSGSRCSLSAQTGGAGWMPWGPGRIRTRRGDGSGECGGWIVGLAAHHLLRGLAGPLPHPDAFVQLRRCRCMTSGADAPSPAGSARPAALTPELTPKRHARKTTQAAPMRTCPGPREFSRASWGCDRRGWWGQPWLVPVRTHGTVVSRAFERHGRPGADTPVARRPPRPTGVTSSALPGRYRC